MKKIIFVFTIFFVCSVYSNNLYHFSYVLSGSASNKPIQIFDDSDKTYIQFKDNEHIPAVFSVNHEGMHLLKMTFSGQFWQISGIFDQFVLIKGDHRAYAIYQGEARLPVKALVYKPFVLQNSDIADKKKVEEIKATTTSSSKVFPTHLWYIHRQDRTLKNVLKSWCQQAGYQLFWKITQDFPILAEAQFEGSFESVLNILLDSVSHTAKPIQAHIYKSNKVLVIDVYPGEVSYAS